jgi:uncharacterized membrane protein YhaH (DUF805 family)
MDESVIAPGSLFSFHGRIRRGTFWIVVVLLNVFSAVLSMGIRALSIAGGDEIGSGWGAVLGLLFGLSPLLVPLFWVALIAYAQRLHVQGVSGVPGWIALTFLIPFLNLLVVYKSGAFPAGTGIFLSLVFGVSPLLVPQLWLGLATNIKRWHDAGLSGWMALTFLIPFVNVVMVLVCGFLPGTEGANKYGRDPRGKPALGPN